MADTNGEDDRHALTQDDRHALTLARFDSLALLESLLDHDQDATEQVLNRTVNDPSRAELMIMCLAAELIAGADEADLRSHIADERATLG